MRTQRADHFCDFVFAQGRRGKGKKGFTHFFPEPGVTVEYVRRFFRAAEQPEKVKKERLNILAALYMRRIGEQFPQHKSQLRELLTKAGLQIASEKLNLYPIYFEEWVDDLMQRAAKPATPGETGS